eukprot:TRINITY_DN113334_c0_g1_i1.p1 TRINITY_DN113334_c0_g1~~TRINITY_DN113334_c0_g1_i1.p1  ORF type:complete len:865 (+),score=215.13 TRINITY_DN113334_c0_g1_i1:200-2794(+)
MTAVVGNAGYPPLLSVQRHPTLEKNVFEQLQRNDIVEARPQIVHFGGFEIHKQHTQRLRIINISPTSLRVTILGPESQYFRIQYDKKGLLAPGMGEEITVVFEPHEWRYYYDSVKVFCGELSENLVIPIHAYPSATDIKLPRIIDFGNVAIGTSRTKTIPLSCSIPIQFEYEVHVLEPHEDFEITPLTGVIPAHSTTEILVKFLPTRFRTARMELRFNISQFDWEPVTITVVGASLPDLSHAEVLQGASSELVATSREQLQEDMADKVHYLAGKRGRGPVSAKAPHFEFDVAEKTVEGVKVPTDFHQQSTNYVINQTAGKLPLKDLTAFIYKQRDKAAKQRRKAEAAHRGEELEEEEELDDDDDTQAKELRFDLQYRDVGKYDKEKELNSRVAVGEEQLTQDVKDSFQEERKKSHAKLIEDMVKADVNRAQSELKEAQPTGVPTSYVHSLAPDWDENNNDMFSLRIQVLDRFIRAGSKCLMRLRVKQAAEQLREAMRTAGVVDRRSCQAWVDQETWAAAANKGGAARSFSSEGKQKTDAVSAALAKDAPDLVDLISLSDDFVLPLQLPTAQEAQNAEDRNPVEVAPLDNFDSFPPFNIQPRMDFKVFDYKEKYALPDPAQYLRPNDGRLVRLSASLEEHSIRGCCGDIFDGAEKPIAMPESCLLPPAHEALSLLLPSPDCRTYVGFPDFTEVDTEYRLAEVPDLVKAPKTEMLLPSDLESLETPFLEEWRPVRQIQDAFMHFDPVAASFAEAGGNLGPRLGFEAGGEKISFLPVGGFNRDLPSDTDDDERDDFESCQDTKPPGEDEYAKVLKHLDRPYTTERWEKEKLAEERLVKHNFEHSKAARDRLNELNQELSRSHKLFLG